MTQRHIPVIVLLSSKKYVTRSDFFTTTTDIFGDARIDSAAFSIHNFRIGAAIAATKPGLPDNLKKNTAGYIRA